MKRLILALALVLGFTGTSRAQDADFQKRLQQEIIQLLKDMDGRIQKLEDKTVFKGYQPYSPPSYSPPSYYSPAPTYAKAPDMSSEERFVMAILMLDQWLGKMDRQLASGQPGYTPRKTSTAALMMRDTQDYKAVALPPREVGGTTAVAKKSSLDLSDPSPPTPAVVQKRSSLDLDENRTTASPTTVTTPKQWKPRFPGDLGD